MDVRIELARPEDVSEVLQLLAAQDLPLDGLREHVGTLLVARHDNRIVGSAALEVYADAALLRSVAVAGARQGRGIGRDLASAALELARHRHVRAVYLLTTTAERYFPRFGFERISREEVPVSVQASIEFQSACPATAIVMRTRLDHGESDSSSQKNRRM